MDKKKVPTEDKVQKPETISDLKKESLEDDGLKKGYNEKNPTQPHGAFVPDSVELKKES